MIETATGKIVDSIPAGHTAHGVAVTPDGKRLYVCNRFNNDVAVIETAGHKQIARVAVTREPYAAAITPDGKSVFVVNHLPLDRADGYEVAAKHQRRSTRPATRPQRSACPTAVPASAA